MRSTLGRRAAAVRSHALAGCAACRALPPLVILWPEDPMPASACTYCGRAMTGTTWVRFIRVDRGPR